MRHLHIDVLSADMVDEVAALMALEHQHVRNQGVPLPLCYLDAAVCSASLTDLLAEGFSGFVARRPDLSDDAIVYICDGEAELREWFRAPVDDRTSFALSNDAGASVTVELVDGAFRGEFTDPAGSVHGFTTEEAIGDAGLYEVDDERAAAEEVWAAWVVDNDGNERGAFLRNAVFQPTPQLASTSFRLSRFNFVGMNGFVQMNGIVAPGR